MTADEQLLYEARMRTRWAVLAAGAGVLLLAGSVVAISGPTTSVSEETLRLIFIHKRAPIDLISSLLNAFALLTFAGSCTTSPRLRGHASRT